MTDFPQTFLRGISQPTDVDFENEVVGQQAFYFGQKTKVSPREDSFNEESINWEDNADVCEFTKNQKNEKGLMFKGGIAAINTSIVDLIKRMPGIGAKFDIERAMLPDNPHHGNLLLDKNINEKKMRQIAATIALSVEKIHPPC